MENMNYAEELVREFLFFRGFTSTLQSFEKELATDLGKGFQKDKIFDLIFSVYIPKFQPENLISLLTFFKQCFSSSETVLIATLSKLEISVLRYYIVYAVQSGRTDKIIEFFGVHGDDLLQRNQDWMSWFAIPYLKNPSLDPLFRVYFSKEWFDALQLSVRNFLSEIFNGTRIPALLKISSEKLTVNHLKNDIKHLNTRLSQLQALLEEKEAQLCRSKRNLGEAHASTTHLSGRQSSDKDVDIPEAQGVSLASSSYGGQSDEKNSSSVGIDELQQEEDFPEVKVDFQETFLGHTSPISCCRFSTSGDNIASASVDGTVRIWTYDASTSASRNATIYCGAEIMSLEWDCKSDRLLLIGTADGGIKAWNVDAKRVVCDLSTTDAFPSVLDLKCSPVEPIFVSAAASRGHGTGYIDKLGFASLTVWNMRTWKAMTVLPLGKDPPAITSLCFNHNGKILAAAATDGMIHMFDMSAGLQITGWPAHDSAISSVLFGPDETSIFSLGTDGKIFEWSLQSQGEVLWSRNCNRFCNPQNSQYHRHEMALDANGKRLLVTSGSVRAPIYQVRDHTNGMKSLPHSAAISTVDWHPTLPIFLTGSADNSVRVTSIL
ncbi:WD repeat-containing protein 91 homolog isoform X3 [Cynara cardunculus var. scolymus]|uniref:WD repeat-containing protein 91 homolog isoform X3 n=1 Tax=Cynara cardunculus var. scolymus TaxID=59895 RepID=UPI000D62C2CB|nr:WD repeat-containing protein 91 homolog isoform X3 [Cynara cardunculus var. scolymus]